MLYFLFLIHTAGSIEMLVETRGGAQHARVHGGTHQIAQRLAEGIAASPHADIITSCPVRCIQGWDASTSASGTTASSDCVQVIAERLQGGSDQDSAQPQLLHIRCARVIVTIPPSTCERVRFAPPLPPVRRQLHSRAIMPCISKFVMRHKSPWWRESGLSGEGIRFTASPSAPICTVFDYCEPAADGGLHAALVGFAAGPVSLGLTRLTPEKRQVTVLRSVAALLGPQALDCSEFHEKLWEADEWSGGGPVNIFPAGHFARFARVLREPVGRLHWAGTETATEWTGYMEGALQSAERAVKEVCGALQGTVAAQEVACTTKGGAFEAAPHPSSRRSCCSMMVTAYHVLHISTLLLVCVAVALCVGWLRVT